MSDLSIKIPYLRQTTTGDLFIYTEPFAKRKDMVPHFGPNPEDTEPPTTNVIPQAVLDAVAAANAEAARSPVVDGAGVPTAVYGSSTLPALVDVKGKSVQLGDIVAAAFQVSGLSADEWNALDADARDGLLNKQIEAQRGTAEKPARKPKAGKKAEAAATEIKTYADGTTATGPAPLPNESPASPPATDDLAAALSNALGTN